MAAPPERMNVNPAMPMNSDSIRRSRWSGLVQSAYPRCPPIDAISAALPVSAGSPPAGSALPVRDPISSLLGAVLQIRRASLGERERIDDPVVQLLTHAVVQRGLLERQIV